MGRGVHHLDGVDAVYRMPVGSPAQHGLPGGLPPALRPVEGHKNQVRMLPRILLGLQASAKEQDSPDSSSASGRG